MVGHCNPGPEVKCPTIGEHNHGLSVYDAGWLFVVFTFIICTLPSGFLNEMIISSSSPGHLLHRILATIAARIDEETCGTSVVVLYAILPPIGIRQNATESVRASLPPNQPGFIIIGK